ncbi:hypothetical protein GDO81_013854 [Engystomops pustulosus]|uniref:Uncharacterized protein n=1 Tax=Engystomops pustulosus TaxID=76066 RepID=A0AAV7B661_ENGPU|nr:hypothetical protein GDO81_013854 [Engystomops pustulosus]
MYIQICMTLPLCGPEHLCSNHSYLQPHQKNNQLYWQHSMKISLAVLSRQRKALAQLYYGHLLLKKASRGYFSP